jgi:hypothetical protein
MNSNNRYNYSSVSDRVYEVLLLLFISESKFVEQSFLIDFLGLFPLLLFSHEVLVLLFVGF